MIEETELIILALYVNIDNISKVTAKHRLYELNAHVTNLFLDYPNIKIITLPSSKPTSIECIYPISVVDETLFSRITTLEEKIKGGI